MVVEAILVLVAAFGVVVLIAAQILRGYVDGVAHSAADQGARAGSRIGVDSVAACEVRAAAALANLAPGAPRRITCSEVDGVVFAHVELDAANGPTLVADASALKEEAPE